jgi:hypothetical protein
MYGDFWEHLDWRRECSTGLVLVTFVLSATRQAARIAPYRGGASNSDKSLIVSKLFRPKVCA